MFAENDGSTKAKAVRYDWSTGIYVSSEANVGKWYVVPLLKADGGVFNPNGTEKAGKTDEGKTDISITIKNPLNTEVDINCTAYIGDNETNRHFKMAASGSKSMTFGAGMFVRMGINEVYLYLVTDVTVTPEEAAVKEAVNVDVQPVEANSIPFEWIEFNWAGFPQQKTGATVIPANKETWVKIDFDNHGVDNGKTYKFYVEKDNATPITINAGVSYDCPASSIQEQSQELKSASTAKILDEAKLSMIPGIIYIRIKAPQELRIYAEQVDIPQPEPGAQPIFNIINGNAGQPAIEVQLDQTYTLNANTRVYSVRYATLKAAENHYRQIEVHNGGTEEVTIVGKASKTPNNEGNVYSVATKTVTIPAGQTYTKKIDKTMQSVVGSDDDDMIWAQGPELPNVTFKLTEQPIDPEYCHDAVAFDWTDWNIQNGGFQWYEVSIAAAKAAKADIILTMKTVDENEEAEITVDIAAACALGEPTQNYTGKSKSTTKTLSYSLFANNSNDVMYVRVRTDKNIKVMAELQTTKTWNGTAWSGTGEAPTLAEAARIEGNLTINSGKILQAKGLTLTSIPASDPIQYYTITIKNGGKLIVGEEGIKGSEVIEQIIVEEGGMLLISPEATTNNKPFVTVKKGLFLGLQDDPNRTQDEYHAFIALPIEDRQAGVGSVLRYVNWDLYLGWQALPNGFRHTFEGYNVFTKDGDASFTNPAATLDAAFKGRLAANKNVRLDVPQWGWYAYGNSWTAPIALEDIYNQFPSGTDYEKAVHFYVNKPTDYTAKGLGIIKDNYYIPATEEIAAALNITKIEPMQGFFLYTEGSYHIDLDYSKVFNANKGTATNLAPKRTAAVDNRNKVAAVLSDGNGSDFVYMIEGQATNAHKIMNNGLAIYAEEGLGQVANDNLIGTTLSIQTNNATEYTLSFGLLNGETMYLKDLVNGNVIAMTENTKYTFNAEPNTTAERFQVVGRNNETTGMENSAVIDGVNKRIENGHVVIIKNGVKYNVLGAQL